MTTETKPATQAAVAKKHLEEAYRKISENNPFIFWNGLILPSALGPQPYHKCMAPFQADFFRDIAPSLVAIRDGRQPEDRRFWLERTKKASKDQDISVCMMWLIAFARRPFFGQVCAANRNQAAIVRDRIIHTLYYNPWLNELIEVLGHGIRNRQFHEARIDIESTDASGGSHGGLPDFLLLNELVHVAKWGAMETHMNNAAGNRRGLVVVATNAGFAMTPAAKWRENAISNPRWKAHVWSQPAPWHDPVDLEEQKKTNTDSEYDRLWWGKWSSGKGDALRAEDIERMFAAGLPPLRKPEPGWRYIGGLDLAVKRHHAAHVVLGINVKEQQLRVARFYYWTPPASGEIDLRRVERQVRKAASRYRLERVVFDPHEARLMSQRLRRQGVPMQEMEFGSPKNLHQMAISLLQIARAGNLQSYDDEDNRMRRDLLKFSIVKKTATGSYRLVAPEDEWGHADIGTALVMCLPLAMLFLEQGRRLMPEDEVAYPVDSIDTFTEDDVKALPPELRDIYEAEAAFAKEREREKRRKRQPMSRLLR